MSGVDTFYNSGEFESLFDNIANSIEPVVSPPVARREDSVIAQTRQCDGLAEDSQDLQELFDSVYRQKWNFSESVVSGKKTFADEGLNGNTPFPEWSARQKVFDQVGHMVRLLRETIKVQNYDKSINETVDDVIPDAKDRLAYISNLTEKAAFRVLNATDVANPLQEELDADAALLAAKWDALCSNKMGVDDFKLLVNETREFLHTRVPQKTDKTKEQLLEIVMAQNFQDLTGQVVKKVATLIQSLELQLMNILIETMPGEKRTETIDSMLNGPVINARGRSDVVVNQKQVDDLLDSLGF